MKSAEIREAFLAFFEQHGHQRVASSSLLPSNDPTLLFTNAGMVQFKDVFLGTDPRSYTRATSSQRCVRAGGKHNDLDNVGYTARHHTFFEMLGNFSFGDYFKVDAIRFAWQFLTETLALPAEKLWVTVYEDDDEAEKIWFEEIGLDRQRFSRLGEKDNFWSMGDTGPCGPCSEIFFDHGPDVVGGPPGSPDEDGDRYIEIWNLVFMQFNRAADGSMSPLPKPSVDTGMGLERVAAVMQGVHSNYDIDLFQNLLAAAARLCSQTDKNSSSLRVIADHIRSCAFMIVDGVTPGNEGRGYVLRRIIRRAIRHGHKLGVSDNFFSQLVPPLVAEMGDAYPELVRESARVQEVLLKEELQFEKTLEQGMRILDQGLSKLSGARVSGELAFKLYDTYGFPVDLTADIARERNLTVDMPGFEAAMQAQRERARKAGQFSAEYGQSLDIEGSTGFCGYDALASQAKVQALFAGEQACEVLEAGMEGAVVLDDTPFYAESGGQVGDRGSLQLENGTFEVSQTVKLGAHHLHQGKMVNGSLRAGERVRAEVDAGQRRATALNHSATHLLHAALREELGEHVTQKGSLVEAARLRFDFSHHEPLTEQQLSNIEDAVNEQIRANSEVQTELMSMDAAMQQGAMALFGEKYGEQVRVLTMGEGYSVELCGGTHVERTGDIGLLRIQTETGIAAGVRRIEALTGQAAFDALRASSRQLAELAQLLKTDVAEVGSRVQQLQEAQKRSDKTLQGLQAKLASSVGSDLASQSVQVGGVNVLAVDIPGADNQALRNTMDQLKNKLGSAIIMLAGSQQQSIALVSGVTKDLAETFPAGELMREVAAQLGGKGGGKAEMAQGAGKDVQALPAVLAAVADWVAARQS